MQNSMYVPSAATNSCIQDSILPEIPTIAQPKHHGQRSFTQLKSKPLSHFHDTYRQAFKARVFNPEKEYASNANPNKQLLNTSRRKPKLSNLDKQLISRLNFISLTIKQLEEYVITQHNDMKMLSRVHEIAKYIETFSEQVDKAVSDRHTTIQKQKMTIEQLKSQQQKLEKENQELYDYNQALVKYEKGINQLKLSHENNRLRLQMEEITRILGERERQIEKLEKQLEAAEKKNHEYDVFRSQVDSKMHKLREELQLSEHTRQLNLALKMKYIMNST